LNAAASRSKASLPLRLSPRLQAPSGYLLEVLRELGWKYRWQADRFCYEPGRRLGASIKLRANMEQEFVIGGYIPEHAASTRCSWAFTGRSKCSE
jgi:hypothetical protein